MGGRKRPLKKREKVLSFKWLFRGSPRLNRGGVPEGGMHYRVSQRNLSYGSPNLQGFRVSGSLTW